MAVEHILGLVMFVVIVLSLSLLLPTKSRRANGYDGGAGGDGGSVGSFSDGGGDCGGGDGGGE